MAQDDIEVGSRRSDHLLSDAQVATSQVGDHASGMRWVTTISVVNDKTEIIIDDVYRLWCNRGLLGVITWVSHAYEAGSRDTSLVHRTGSPRRRDISYMLHCTRLVSMCIYCATFAYSNILGVKFASQVVGEHLHCPIECSRTPSQPCAPPTSSTSRHATPSYGQLLTSTPSASTTLSSFVQDG